MKGLCSSPDLVVCGVMQFHDQCCDVLLNPLLIIEVLFASTEAFDRGEKFRHYRTWLPTLMDYLLVAQDKPLIDHAQLHNCPLCLTCKVQTTTMPLGLSSHKPGAASDHPGRRGGVSDGLL
jgi:Uma2 family endonuclease